MSPPLTSTLVDSRQVELADLAALDSLPLNRLEVRDPSMIEADEITREPWAAVEDVAKHLGVAKDSVYRWIEGRGLPAHRVGRLWKFKLTEIDQWVRSGGADLKDPQGRG